MIYVRRDPSLIPEKLLKVAERAQAQLEALPAAERVSFIKRKSRIWRAFARYLAKMSYGKCWYSEANDPQSFFDVDHFRPKGEATRADGSKDGGYPWLAFSWENFRYSAQRSNRLSTNEETEELSGKGSEFPLMEGSPVACWDDRCVGDEKPILLDPTDINDARLVEVGADGRLGPSRYCLGSNRTRVRRSIVLLGLDLPQLKGARLRVMREVEEQSEILLKTLKAGEGSDEFADAAAIDLMIRAVQEKTHPKSPYSLAARSQLILMGLGDLCVHPEEADG